MLDILVCVRNGDATDFSRVQFMGALRRPKATKMQLVPEVVIVSIKAMCMVALFLSISKEMGSSEKFSPCMGEAILDLLGFTPA